MKLRVKLKNQNPPDKKNLISPKRAYEIADSLDKQSVVKKKIAYEQKRIGDATVKNKVADKQVLVDKYLTTLSGNDRLKIAEKAKREATSDSLNAARYRALADKELKKNK